MTTRYLLALGSNRRHGRYGTPAAVLAAAMAMLEEEGLRIVARAPVIETAPVGPGGRRFANAALLAETDDAPPALLARLKRMERRFGRRPGQRWGPRVLDLDIAFWSGGRWRSPDLIIPHCQATRRDFVLKPLAAVAPRWRDPASGRTIRQLLARLTRRRPVDRPDSRP